MGIRDFEPQNKEPQNVEVLEYFIIRHSLFDIRYSGRKSGSKD